MSGINPLGRPIDYNSEVVSPFKMAVDGYKAGADSRTSQMEFEEKKRARDQAIQMQTELAEVASNPKHSTQDIINLTIKYPLLSQHFKQTYDMMDSEKQNTTFKQTAHVYSALKNGQVDIAKKILQEQKDAATNSGLTNEANGADILLKQIELNPESATLSTGLALSSITGPDKFADTMKSLGFSVSKSRIASEKEKIDAGLNPKTVYEINEKGGFEPVKIGDGTWVDIKTPPGQKGIWQENTATKEKREKSSGGTSVTTNVNTGNTKYGPVPEGMRLRILPGGSAVMEPIEGGPVAEANASKSFRVNETANNVLLAVDDAVGLINGSKLPLSGPGIALAERAPGGQAIFSSRQALKAAVQTIQANLAFDELRKIKDSSKTGGTLGAVSDAEMALLKNAKTSLDLDKLDDKTIIKNLGKIKTAYSKLMEYPSVKTLKNDVSRGTQQKVIRVKF